MNDLRFLKIYLFELEYFLTEFLVILEDFLCGLHSFCVEFDFVFEFNQPLHFLSEYLNLLFIVIDFLLMFFGHLWDFWFKSFHQLRILFNWIINSIFSPLRSLIELWELSTEPLYFNILFLYSINKMLIFGL